MKVIIQIPCYNEEETLPVTLSELPRKLPGVDEVEWLVIDDGSTDRTVDVAKTNGADYVIHVSRNQGLAKTFMTGLEACLEAGADIIVNTDADNQYCADCIPDLIKPILEGNSEIVIGARPIDQIQHFSPLKKFLEKLGSRVVRMASHTDIPDAPSGFRAISKKAARQINVFNKYTYTLEMIIQAGQKNIPITWIPIRTNQYLRPSRLVRSIPYYAKQSIFTIVRIFVVYKPFWFFMSLGTTLFFLGSIIGLRFLYFYVIGQGGGHVQSLVLASILIGIGFQTMLIAFITDLLSVNRRLLEDLQYKSRESKTHEN